ncbi:hypothetical protein THAOC_07728, partial [Thalassiosira oceanica]
MRVSSATESGRPDGGLERAGLLQTERTGRDPPRTTAKKPRTRVSRSRRARRKRTDLEDRRWGGWAEDSDCRDRAGGAGGETDRQQAASDQPHITYIMRANPSSKALAVLLAVLASAVSSARAKQLRATAADERDYGDKKNKGDKGDVIDSNDEPGRRQPGASYGRAIKDLFGSVPVQVETRCSDGHEYKLISPEHCKPSLGGEGSSRNLQPGGGGEGEARLLVRADDAAPRVCQ